MTAEQTPSPALPPEVTARVSVEAGIGRTLTEDMMCVAADDT